MAITAGNLNADSIQPILREREKQRAEQMRNREETAKVAREKLHEVSMTEDVTQDALDQAALMVRKAVEIGEGQVLLFRLPSNWLPDRGRVIKTMRRSGTRTSSGPRRGPTPTSSANSNPGDSRFTPRSSTGRTACRAMSRSS